MSIQYDDFQTPRADMAVLVDEYKVNGMNLIARKVLPKHSVHLEEASGIPVLKRENLKLEDMDHANGATFPRIDTYLGETGYKCVDRGLEGKVTKKDYKKYATQFDAEASKVKVIRRKVLLGREKRVADKVFNPAFFAGPKLYTDNSSAPWDDITTMIADQIQAGMNIVRANMGLRANTLVINDVSFQNMKKNTQLLGRFPGVQILTMEMIESALAAVCGIKQILVGDAIYDSAAEGQDFVSGDIWSDDYAMVCAVSEGALEEGGLGRTFEWDEMDQEDDAVVQYPESQTDSNVFRIREYTDENIFEKFCGHLIKIGA